MVRSKVRADVPASHAASAGYMDVAPNTGQATGYMDVAATRTTAGFDDDEEDV